MPFPTQGRAFSVLKVKEFDAEQRIIRGIASTPEPDRMGDVVEPMGAIFQTPMPLLWQHKKDQPVGHVTFAAPTAKGIPFEARILDLSEPGTLKDRCDEAWQSVKAGLVTAVSVGFNPVMDQIERLKSGGLRYKKWEWFELSLVTIPANVSATIHQIKAFDADLRAASGTQEPAENAKKPRTGAPVVKLFDSNTEENPTVNIAEQIKAFEAKRATQAAALQALIQKSADEGRSLDAAEAEQFDTLSEEIKSVDDHLARLRTVEKSMGATAAPVGGVSDATKVANVINKHQGTENVRNNSVITVERQLPKGTAFTRYAIALARSKGNLMQAAEIAKGWNSSTPEVETVLKAAVAAGTTTDPAWAAPLVEYQNMASEFIELLRPQTIVGRMNRLRRVPFNIRMPGQTSGSSVGWVGEGRAKPVSALGFDTNTLRFTKVAGIVVLTDELVRFSNPSAEAIVTSDLTASIAEFLDGQFIDPTVAEVANVSPASITNGATAIPASGTSADALRTDVRALFASFIAANLTPTNGVFIMSPTSALAISMMLNPLGQPEFPGLTMNGGTFFGLPVITSETAGNLIVLANESEILMADDGGVTLDVSREASLEMSTTPDGSGQMVSLWQNNMVGLRAERFINWKRRRPQAVAYISGADYGNEAAAGGGA